MIVLSTCRGTVALETHDPFEEVTPERAEAMAAELLEAASDARRRTNWAELGQGAPREPWHWISP